MNMTFLAHDEDSNMRLIKHTASSSSPDVNKEWENALEKWRDKVPLLGALTLVGALMATEDLSVRWYPDIADDVSVEKIGKTIH